MKNPPSCMEMKDRFPKQSKINFTSLIDKKNGQNTKKATKGKYDLKFTNEIMPLTRLVQPGGVRFIPSRKQERKQTGWMNDKTIIELGYRKISWFDCVSLAD